RRLLSDYCLPTGSHRRRAQESAAAHGTSALHANAPILSPHLMRAVRIGACGQVGRVDPHVRASGGGSWTVAWECGWEVAGKLRGGGVQCARSVVECMRRVTGY